jgi:hypothetical protein
MPYHAAMAGFCHSDARPFLEILRKPSVGIRAYSSFACSQPRLMLKRPEDYLASGDLAIDFFTGSVSLGGLAPRYRIVQPGPGREYFDQTRYGQDYSAKG